MAPSLKHMFKKSLKISFSFFSQAQGRRNVKDFGEERLCGRHNLSPLPLIEKGLSYLPKYDEDQSLRPYMFRQPCSIYLAHVFYFH